MEHKKHKHSDVIKAWADGAKVEYFSKARSLWLGLVVAPEWHPDVDYRVSDDYTHIREARKLGIPVQYYSDVMGVWYDIPSGATVAFTSPVDSYRLKPTSRIIEVTMGIGLDGTDISMLDDGVDNQVQFTFIDGKLTSVTLL